MENKLDPILISIKTDAQEVSQKISRLKESLKGLDKRRTTTKNKIRELNEEVAKLNILRGKAVARNKELSGSLGNLTKGMHGADKATGAATTSVLELGRVVSDAPYGIRGMANNVSQLASNMLFGAQQIDKTTGKAVGFMGVLKGMGKVFTGPLGLLFVIQAVVSALDFFAGGMKKAENASKKLGESAGKSVGEFRRLNVILQDGRVSLEDRTEALKKLKKEYPKAVELIKSYQKNLSTANNTITESIELEKEYTKVIIEEAKRRAARKKIEEKSSELFELEDERNKELKSAKSRLLELAYAQEDSDRRIIESSIKVMEAELDRSKSVMNQNKAFKEASIALAQYQSNINVGRVAVDNFTLGLFKNRKDINELNDEITKYATNSIDFEEQKRKEAEKLAKELLKLAIGELELRRDINEAIISDEKTIDKEKIRLLNENFQISLSIIEKERDFRNKDLTDSELDLTKRKNSLIKFNKEYVSLQAKLRDDLAKFNVSVKPEVEAIDTSELQRGIVKGLGEQEIPEIIVPIKPFIYEEGILQKIELFIERYKSLMGGVTEFIDGEFQREITIEENKTNALNTELNDRLLNENLSKEERKNIQNEIWQNDEALRVKKEAIEKKQFKLQKAANIAVAMIETYSAAMSAYRNTLANPLNKLLPDAGLLKAKISAGIATVGGLAQVAAISRQKFQSSASKSPINVSGGGGGSEGKGDRDFNFNLVGNTQTNQLAEAIQGQFSQPLKAFVVSKDVTTQQELDANIKGTATF